MPLYLKDRLTKAARQARHTISHGFPIYPWYFNYDKKDLIDLAFLIATPSPRSFADLGGVWGVNAAYTFYSLDKHEISSAYLVDTNFTPVVLDKSKQYDNLTLVEGNFGDAKSVEQVGKVDAVFLFDVLLHQVKPDWDEVLRIYSEITNCFIIFNQQYIPSESTVRLIDLGEEEYFRNVPRSYRHAHYRAIFEKPDEINPEHNRPWRDIHNVWQWGITDSDLRKEMDGLGYEELHYKDCGQFGYLKNFRNRAFIFRKR